MKKKLKHILVENIKKGFALFKKPFAKFLFKKLVFLLVTIFLSFTLLFILPYFMPSNPVDMMIARVAANPGTTAVKLAEIREKYIRLFGLDKPLIEQYGLFWRRVFTLDFGTSIEQNQDIGFLIGEALVWTLVLIIPAWILSFIVGNNYLGAKAAFSKNKFIHAFYTIAVYLNSAPYYWFGLILVYALAVNLRLFPSHGAYSPLWMKPSLNPKFILDVGYHYVLPFLSIFITGIGNWCTGMRAMTIYERQSDYIYYSKQLGFRENKLRKYAQKNAILPQVTGLPIILSSLIGQTMIVEYVFGWPGLGTIMYQALTAIDYPLMQAGFVFTVLLVLIGNFVMDIIYGFIDPRIRMGYVGG